MKSLKSLKKKKKQEKRLLKISGKAKKCSLLRSTANRDPTYTLNDEQKEQNQLAKTT